MSMMRKIFRPGKGQRHARYAPWYISSATTYRGDYVVLDTTSPATQGVATDGVVGGEQLGAQDFIYATTTTGTLLPGSSVGVIEGVTIGDRNTTTAITQHTIAIVQTFGVFDTHCQVDTATAKGDLLLGYSTVAGQLLGKVAIGAAATNGYNDGYIVGSVLITDANYTRGAVTTTKGVTAFLKVS